MRNARRRRRSACGRTGQRCRCGYSRGLYKPYRYVNVIESGGSLSGDARAELVSLDANGELRAFPNVDGMNLVWGEPRVVGNGWTEPARVFFA